MSIIRGVIFSECATILSEGMASVLNRIESFSLHAVCHEESELHSLLKTGDIGILFLIVSELNERSSEIIKNLRLVFPRIRMLITSPQVTKASVFGAVKCGANGFICVNTPLQEIKEAVYTVRSGHDYFSSSIANLLVSNYVEAIRSDGASHVKNIDKLSKRELEILTLWGEGITNAEIASRLFISIRTVETHKNHLMQKLRIRTTVDLLKFAIRNNLISI